MRNLKKQNNQPTNIIASQQISRQYKWPLPLPQHFEWYEKVLPGAAERIMCMAEKHSDVVVSEIEKASRRDFTVTIIVISCTFLFAFSGMAVGTYLLIIGKTGVAIGTMFGSAIFLLVTLLRSFFKNPNK